jgi:hypothetical protein
MDTNPNGLKRSIEMDEEKKVDQDNSVTAEQAERKPWQPMRLTIAGDAKDVIRHGTPKTSPGIGDPGEILKIPGQAEH